MTIQQNKREFFECNCKSAEHTISFLVENYEDTNETFVVLEIQLTQWRAWFKRIIPALKYLFGIKTANSHHWDCFILDSADINRLEEMLKYVKEKNKES